MPEREANTKSRGTSRSYVGVILAGSTPGAHAGEGLAQAARAHAAHLPATPARRARATHTTRAEHTRRVAGTARDTHNACRPRPQRCGRSTRHTQRLRTTTATLRPQHTTRPTWRAQTPHARRGGRRRHPPCGPAETGLTPRHEGARTMTHQHDGDSLRRRATH